MFCIRKTNVTSKHVAHVCMWPIPPISRKTRRVMQLQPQWPPHNNKTPVFKRANFFYLSMPISNANLQVSKIGGLVGWATCIHGPHAYQLRYLTLRLTTSILVEKLPPILIGRSSSFGKLVSLLSYLRVDSKYLERSPSSPPLLKIPK